MRTREHENIVVYAGVGLFSIGTEGRALFLGPLAVPVDIESSKHSLWDVLSGVRPGSQMKVTCEDSCVGILWAVSLSLISFLMGVPPNVAYLPAQIAAYFDVRYVSELFEAEVVIFRVMLWIKRASYLALLWLLSFAPSPSLAYWSIYANTFGHYHYRLLNRTSLRFGHSRQKEVAMDTVALKYSIL